MSVVKKSAKKVHTKMSVKRIQRKKLGNIKYHGYTYNNNVITNLFSRGFAIELKGGYKL